MHNDKIGLKELSPEELKELLSSEPSQEEQARMQRRRRQAFLQREAGRLLNIRKNVALEFDLDAKAALVQEHTDAVVSTCPPPAPRALFSWGAYYHY